MEVALRILPLFALVAVGAAAARLGALNAAAVSGLTRYVNWIALPALLIRALAATPLPGPDEARGLVAYGLAMAVPYAVAAGAAAWRRWPADARAALPLLAGANNDAFLGAPMVLAVFGAATAAHTGPLLALNRALLLPLGLVALHRGAHGGGLAASLRGALLSPVTLSALVGVALMLAGPVRWPPAVGAVLGELAASSTPTALAALGAVIALEGPRPARGEGAPVLLAVALRLLAAPALVWIALTLAGAPADMRIAATVLAACPTAIVGFIQAQHYGLFARGAAQVVALSTLASAVTLTLLAAALGGGR